MTAITQGKREAFEQIYERYFHPLCRFARTILQNDSEAEDVVQEVFMRLIDGNHGYDATRKFSTWIFTLTANRAKNLVRNLGNRDRILNEMQPNSAIDYHDEDMILQMDRTLLTQMMRDVLDSKSPKEKQLYALRFERDLSIAEIAEILNIPIGSVKSGLYYLLKKIAREWKEKNYEHR
ncbi:MAG: sigma-70 family RNA polymerase sigma factor [Flavobacteriales bacterium]|nr:sigma-70 family RNA polymerase sigma factor [Flavobacteriales bacterium]